MLPDNALSTSALPSGLMSPIPSSPLIDYARRLDKQVVKGEWQAGKVVATVNGIVQAEIVIPQADRIGFALDANNFYVVAVQHPSGNYVKHDVNTYPLESGISNIVANLDYASHLPTTFDFRDVVVAYIKNNSLWCVYQRENYAIPRLLKNNVSNLFYMCPNQEYRLQFGVYLQAP